MQSAPRFYSYLNETREKKNIARPAESRPTEKIYFRSVPYYHTECLSVAS